MPVAPTINVGVASQPIRPWNGAVVFDGNTGYGGNSYYMNDSSVPLVMSKDGRNILAFLGDGWPSYYIGPDPWALNNPPIPPGVDTTKCKTAPPSGWQGATCGTLMQPATGYNGMLGHTTGPYNLTGSWLLQANRAPDGTLVALIHGENHVYAQTAYDPYTNANENIGQFDSSGIWTSSDDGMHWIDTGIAAGEWQPSAPTFNTNGVVGTGGGMGAFAWDPINNRWLGIAGTKLMVSYDPHGVGGTWYGMDNCGNFTIPVIPTQPTSSDWTTTVQPMQSWASAAGTTTDTITGLGPASLSWNTYLNEFILIATNSTQLNTVMAFYSRDGIWWTHSQVLYTPGAQSKLQSGLWYASLVGPTWSNGLTAQRNTIVYETSPTGPWRADIRSVPIWFGPPFAFQGP